VTGAGTLALFAVTVATLRSQAKTLAILRRERRDASLSLVTRKDDKGLIRSLAVTNAGPSVAYEVDLRFVDGTAQGWHLYLPDMPLTALLPAQPYSFSLGVVVGASDHPRAVLSWTDGNGRHEETVSVSF
jgi:hypothetical protein